jgi:hypothetical protein
LGIVGSAEDRSRSAAAPLASEVKGIEEFESLFEISKTGCSG